MQPLALLELAYELTPVQEIDGILFKRDDLFLPFGRGSLNGGKLRQGIHLLSKAKEEGYTYAVTGCSLLSAQGPIVAAVAQNLGMKCVVLYGGTKLESLFQRHHMPKLTQAFGAVVGVESSGRSNVLLNRCKQIARSREEAGEKVFVVEYGVNSKDPKHFTSFYDTTAQQVQNLPDNLVNLVVDCGSGITATGILYGLIKYNKHVKNVWVVGTAPRRKRRIKDRLAFLSVLTGIDCWNAPFEYVDLFEQGLRYEDRVEGTLGDGTQLHPNYEGKVWAWLQAELPFQELQNYQTCFWIVGAEPKVLEK